MSAQIEDLISKCATCQRHRSSNPKEPLHPHQLPQRPWQRVATDLFEWKKRPHLLVVDYYSRYPEVAELRDMRAKTVISKMKSFSVGMAFQMKSCLTMVQTTLRMSLWNLQTVTDLSTLPLAQGTHKLEAYMSGPCIP